MYLGSLTAESRVDKELVAVTSNSDYQFFIKCADVTQQIQYIYDLFMQLDTKEQIVDISHILSALRMETPVYWQGKSGDLLLIGYYPALRHCDWSR